MMKSSAIKSVVLCVAGAAVCFTAAFLQCTASLTGGNSSETTNVAVVTSDGKPAVSAKVKLIDAENWAFLAAKREDVVLDSAITGPDGLVSFENLPDIMCNLQVDYPGSGVLVRNFCIKGKIVDEKTTIRLQKYATLLGSYAPDSGPASSIVMLEGSSYRSVINADRSFAFPGVGPGMYPLVLGNSTGRLSLAGNAILLEGETLSKDAMVPDFADLLIDDFESGYSTGVLGRITDGSWYTYSDTAFGGGSTVIRTLQSGAPQGVFALNTDIVLRHDLFPNPFAGVGIYIGAKKTDWDFSAMTAISFWARGRNTIRVSVESRLVDSIQSWPDFGATLALGPAWRHFRIPVDSLVLLSSKAKSLGVTWATAARSIYKIEFEASRAYSIGDTVKMQLDDIRIEGISASDLFLQIGHVP